MVRQPRRAHARRGFVARVRVRDRHGRVRRSSAPGRSSSTTASAGWDPAVASKTQLANMQTTSVNPPAAAYHLSAWPIIYGTILTTGIAVVLGVVIAVLSSIFIVELAPARLRRVAIPVIRLLASVPSVIYGLIGDPRARAVRRQPSDHQRAEDLRPELCRAHRGRSAGRDGDV